MKIVFRFVFILLSVVLSSVSSARTSNECVGCFLAKGHSRPITIKTSKELIRNATLEFVPHPEALAMNVHVEPVRNLREKIQKALRLKLHFLQSWNVDGEAHVTVIPPPEFKDVLRNYVSEEKLNEIATQNQIQAADLQVMGLGHGEATIDGKKEQTYFVIVRSKKLLEIRKLIYEEFLKNGGKPGSWDPSHFFPHITVGYTSRDLHEADGVIKDEDHSLDSRFYLKLR